MENIARIILKCIINVGFYILKWMWNNKILRGSKSFCETIEKSNNILTTCEEQLHF